MGPAAPLKPLNATLKSTSHQQQNGSHCQKEQHQNTPRERQHSKIRHQNNKTHPRVFYEPSSSTTALSMSPRASWALSLACPSLPATGVPGKNPLGKLCRVTSIRCGTVLCTTACPICLLRTLLQFTTFLKALFPGPV